MCTPPRADKIFLAKFTGESCKCTLQVVSAPQAEEEYILEETGEVWRVGVVNLVIVAYVLKVTTKKVVNFLEQEQCTPRENPGYAYDRRALIDAQTVGAHIKPIHIRFGVRLVF